MIQYLTFLNRGSYGLTIIQSIHKSNNSKLTIESLEDINLFYLSHTWQIYLKCRAGGTFNETGDEQQHRLMW